MTRLHCRPRKGFTYRTPDGYLGFIVEDSEDQAITSAAMAYNGRSYCERPRDWDRAQAAGWAIVPVTMTVEFEPDSRRSTPAYAKGGLQC